MSKFDKFLREASGPDKAAANRAAKALGKETGDTSKVIDGIDAIIAEYKPTGKMLAILKAARRKANTGGVQVFPSAWEALVNAVEGAKEETPE